ncbi:MAG: acyltransferase family protein [Prevotella sp.]|jgi:predicted acyltransferase
MLKHGQENIDYQRNKPLPENASPEEEPCQPKNASQSEAVASDAVRYPNKKRLVSLDVFRGLTVMFMIFVNNGAGDEIFHPLTHSAWNGMTPCDLVFPFFIFIMGMSTYLSLKKTQFRCTRQTLAHVLRRTLLLFLIGLAINWTDMAFSGHPFDMSHLRIMGVMQRLGLCYGCCALSVMAIVKLTGKLHGVVILSGLLLVVYSVILLGFGGYEQDPRTNILAIVDQQVLGFDHLYHKSAVDPEGLLSTLSAIAQTLLGFYVAFLALGRTSNMKDKVTMLLTAGALLTVIGGLLSYGMPLNKRVWSPSYALLTSGLACSVLALLALAIDQGKQDTGGIGLGLKNMTLVFGTNPLLLYVVSEILAIIFGATGVKEAVYQVFLAFVGNGYWASVVYATAFVALHALMGYPLWKRHIFVKL